MTQLFSVALPSEKEETNYEVYFNEEAYHFKPEGGGQEIILRREGDEWKTEGVNEKLAIAAIAALDKYLLSQH